MPQDFGGFKNPTPPGDQEVLMGARDEDSLAQIPGEQSPASEASGSPEAEGKAAPAVLDDPRSIEDSPDYRHAKGYYADKVDTETGDIERFVGKNLKIDAIERMQREDRRILLYPNGEAWELFSAPPADHAKGRPHRGVARIEPEDMPEPEPPVDRAKGTVQQGVAGNPNPVAFNSGMNAFDIAAVAYGTVQSYKGRIGQIEVPWIDLAEATQRQIAATVVRVMSEGHGGPVYFHQAWQTNMLARGITAEEDPRIETPWGNMEPAERRKAMIFAQVVMALLREA